MSIDFSPDGETLAAACDNGFISVFDSDTGEQQQSFKAMKDPIRDIAFTSDGKAIV